MKRADCLLWISVHRYLFTASSYTSPRERFAYVKHRAFSLMMLLLHVHNHTPHTTNPPNHTTCFPVSRPAMFRPASRSLRRSAQASFAPARTAATKRFLSTAPPHQKSRSWKSSAARWGLAIAALYYYNTSELFAEQPAECTLC